MTDRTGGGRWGDASCSLYSGALGVVNWVGRDDVGHFLLRGLWVQTQTCRGWVTPGRAAASSRPCPERALDGAGVLPVLLPADARGRAGAGVPVPAGGCSAAPQREQLAAVAVRSLGPLCQRRGRPQPLPHRGWVFPGSSLCWSEERLWQHRIKRCFQGSAPVHVAGGGLGGAAQRHRAARGFRGGRAVVPGWSWGGFPSVPRGAEVNFLFAVSFDRFCTARVEFACLSLAAGPGGPAEGAGEKPERVPREPLRLGEGPGQLPQLQAAGAQERPPAQPAPARSAASPGGCARGSTARGSAGAAKRRGVGRGWGRRAGRSSPGARPSRPPGQSQGIVSVGRKPGGCGVRPSRSQREGWRGRCCGSARFRSWGQRGAGGRGSF